jgi:hypothetical protein
MFVNSKYQNSPPMKKTLLLLALTIFSKLLVAQSFLDPAFADTGLIVTDFPNEEMKGNSEAIQPDGKIIIAGEVGDVNLGGGLLLLRYDENGLLDSSFAQNGALKYITPEHYIANY